MMSYGHDMAMVMGNDDAMVMLSYGHVELWSC